MALMTGRGRARPRLCITPRCPGGAPWTKTQPWYSTRMGCPEAGMPFMMVFSQRCSKVPYMPAGLWQRGAAFSNWLSKDLKKEHLLWCRRTRHPGQCHLFYKETRPQREKWCSCLEAVCRSAEKLGEFLSPSIHPSIHPSSI